MNKNKGGMTYEYDLDIDDDLRWPKVIKGGDDLWKVVVGGEMRVNLSIYYSFGGGIVHLLLIWVGNCALFDQMVVELLQLLIVMINLCTYVDVD